MEAQKWILKTGNGWLVSIPAVQLEELVPPVLTDLVDTQLAALPLEQQEILEAESTIGLEFTSQLVAYALNKFLQVIDEACSTVLDHSRWLQPAGFATAPDGQVSSPQFDFGVRSTKRCCARDRPRARGWSATGEWRLRWSRQRPAMYRNAHRN
jgi:hypothetical protein